MAHQALYREFRPQTFQDVVGQQHITRTLRNALKQKRLHHAYLLSGPRGTGKTTVARLIAKAVNCRDLQEGEPCNLCAACASILNGETMDIIEIDAASNRGVDEIRDLREKVKYAPADLTYKVYIIDEVHMLTEPAFNALLKTLEEPPAHVLFVLATTEKHKLPVTIVSRCQSFEYHRLSAQEIVNRLRVVCEAYRVTATPEALAAVARQADGGMRDALSLLDQILAYIDDRPLTLEDTLHVLGSAPLDQFLRMDSHLIEGDVGAVLLLLDDLIRQGKDLRQFVRDFLAHLRDLLICKVSSGSVALDLPASAAADVSSRAKAVQQQQILAAIRLFAQLESDLRFSASPRLLTEVALIRTAGLFTGTDQPDLEESQNQPLPRKSEQPSNSALPRDSSNRVRGESASAPAWAPAPSPVAANPPTTAVQAEESPGPVAAVPNHLAQAWDQVIGLVKVARPSTHPLLIGARIGPIRGKSITLVTANTVLANLLKRQADMVILQKAFAKVGFEGYEIMPVGPEHPAAKADLESAPPVTEQAGPSLVDVARSVFPRELVQEVEEEGSR